MDFVSSLGILRSLIMLRLPVVSKLTYDGRERVAIERGPGKGGLLHYQVKPEYGYRTFKPEKMMDRIKLGPVATLYYLAKSIRIG